MYTKGEMKVPHTKKKDLTPFHCPLILLETRQERMSVQEDYTITKRWQKTKTRRLHVSYIGCTTHLTILIKKYNDVFLSRDRASSKWSPVNKV